ncbi:MAG TPA: crotonase/enoyl-CoA hydratase family protein [Dehalococcoidales bacterium]|nr:crotonase/enoyl-CoA hydratase family protein [Dehalococcoidales bacterium]
MEVFMSYENILYEVSNRIARITLNRPEKLNALSDALLEEYAAALVEAERDPEVGVVVVRAAGRAFCAGYDVGGGSGHARMRNEAPFLADRLRLQSFDDKITTAWRLVKPVIAQVHGICVAGGNDIAGQCDIIIAAENATFGHPQIRRLGLTWMHMFPYKCGAQWSKILMFTGDSISGKEAERIGVVARAVPEDKLEEEVDKLAARIALVDPTLLAMNKLAVNRVFEEMGMRNAFNAANAFDTIAHTAEAMQEFNRIAREQGLRAALEANEGPFRQSPRPF